MARVLTTPSRSGGLMERGFAANPFQLLQREVNRIFDDVFRGEGMPLLGGAGAEGAFLMPRIDARETENAICIAAELPGVAEKDIEVALDEDVLTIRAEKKLERREERENTHFTERAFGTFQRSVQLPGRVDADQVKASFENGVLTITLPKNKAQERSKKIPVQAGGQQQLTGDQQQRTEGQGGSQASATAESGQGTSA